MLHKNTHTQSIRVCIDKKTNPSYNKNKIKQLKSSTNFNLIWYHFPHRQRLLAPFLAKDQHEKAHNTKPSTTGHHFHSKAAKQTQTNTLPQQI